MTDTEITSPSNPQVRQIRRLHTRRERARSGLFIAEGEDLVAAAAAAGRKPRFGLRAAGSGLGGEGFTDASERALAAASTLGSSTRVIGVYEQQWGTPAGDCVYLHGVRDPGNVGTIMRSATAFGFAGLVLGPRCADPHGPKCVRASMGALFALTLGRGVPGGRTVALDAHRGAALSELEPVPGPTTLLVGAERDGLPGELVDGADAVARIPIQTESLNAAMAATVAMYEMTRPSSRVPAS